MQGTWIDNNHDTIYEYVIFDDAYKWNDGMPKFMIIIFIDKIYSIVLILNILRSKYSYFFYYWKF